MQRKSKRHLFLSYTITTITVLSSNILPTESVATILVGVYSLFLSINSMHTCSILLTLFVGCSILSCMCTRRVGGAYSLV